MAISNGYCTLADVKAALRITDTVDDALLEVAVESASRLIDGYTNRYFYNAGTATKIYLPSSSYEVYTDDFQTSSITLRTYEDGAFTTWASADYQLEPLNQSVGGVVMPYYRIRAIDDPYFPMSQVLEYSVELTAVFGWASVPTAIKQACVVQAMRLFKRLESPTGVLGYGTDLGVVRVSGRIDPDVAMLINPYRKMRATVAV